MWFEVKDSNPFSDHAIISFEIKCKVLNSIEDLSYTSHPDISNKVKWNEKNSNTFINYLNSNKTVDTLNEIYNKLECTGEVNEILFNESVALI